MYAIVDIAGQQFKAEPGKKIFVHQLNAEAGSEITFDKVLLFADDNGGIQVGNKAQASVKAIVIAHQRGKKVIVFKKKRRKGYKVKNGHRQYFTQIEIKEING